MRKHGAAAAERCDLDIVVRLLKAKADPNPQGVDALKNGVPLLLAATASLSIEDEKKPPPEQESEESPEEKKPAAGQKSAAGEPDQ